MFALPNEEKPILSNLLSMNRRKIGSEVTRKIYMSRSPSKKQKKCMGSLGKGSYKNLSVCTLLKDIQVTIGRKNGSKSYEKGMYSDRRSLKKKENSLDSAINLEIGAKLAKSKFNSSYGALQKIYDRSTMISAILANSNHRLQKLKEGRRLHEYGKNCRVVVIENMGDNYHFIYVTKMGDILDYLRTEYPRSVYFKSVPSQLTMDYLLMQESIVANFLNGQSLYLKLCGNRNSTEERQQVGLDSFEILKMIGSGGFSKVFLSRFKETGYFLAMKVIDKHVIVKNKKKRIIMNERNIMKTSKHPFMIDMKFAFETENTLVFIMEYCPGGELFSLIKKYKRINEDIARFYIIEIFLGLAYLHQNHVVYRDIKPENILLTKDGHIKIADLGLAKPDMTEGIMAYSFCGSPYYMSPEMILQVGHTYPVDYYCMGALLYYLLVGLPPFYSRDTNEIYEAVLSDYLHFPYDIDISKECKSLLRGLLCKYAKLRLGSIHGVKYILSHPWFGKNSYKNFLDKQIATPVKFDSVAKIDLEKPVDYKHKKDLDDILKLQKTESKHFKPVMKNFYYDYRGVPESLGVDKENSVSKRKLILSTSRNKKYRSLTRKMSNKLLPTSITYRT